MNSQKKGKRIELFFAKKLREIFPEVRRTGFLQSQSGGVDLENTGCFNFEVKGGKLPKKNEQMLEQIKQEGKPENYDVVLCKRDRCQPYVMMPLADFLEILHKLKKEGVI